MIFIYIFLYLIFLVVCYIAIIKRLKNLSQRHMQNTGIKSLSRGYIIVKRRLIVIFIILFFLSTLVFITFTENELLPQVWLLDDKKTLDNNDF
jgi:hypothetical protein